jgi:hypothetical protein
MLWKKRRPYIFLEDEDITKLKNDAHKKLDEYSKIILNGEHIHDGSEWGRKVQWKYRGLKSQS